MGAVPAVAMSAPVKFGTPKTLTKAFPAALESLKSKGDAALPLLVKLNSATLFSVVVPNATVPDKFRLTVSIKKLVRLIVPVVVVSRKPLPLCAIVPANDADKSPPVMGNRTTGTPPTLGAAVAVPNSPRVTPAPVSVGADTNVTVVNPPTTGMAKA